MKKRLIEILVGTMLTAALITGCGSKDNAAESTVNTANTTENTDTAKTGDAEKGIVVYGQVSEIGDSSITIEVGTQKEMEKPDNVEFEDMADGEMSEMPEMPEGMGDGEMPEDMGNGEISQMPKEMNGGEEITLADISVGDIVMITYNENGEIEKIVVISMNNAQMPSEDAAEEPAEDTAASAEEEAAAEE